MSARRQRLARALSLLGHPAVLMPLAVPSAAHLRGAPADLLQQATAAAVLVAALVAAYSLWQVRAGRWRHVDASVPAERRQLNRFLLGVLVAAAAAAWGLAAGAGEAAGGGADGVGLVPAAGLGAAAAVALAAAAMPRGFRASLHVAYGALAAALAWPVWPAVAALGLLLAGVAWSRHALGRHTPAELAVGLGLGLLAGCLFNLLAPVR